MMNCRAASLEGVPHDAVTYVPATRRGGPVRLPQLKGHYPRGGVEPYSGRMIVGRALAAAAPLRRLEHADVNVRLLATRLGNPNQKPNSSI